MTPTPMLTLRLLWEFLTKLSATRVHGEASWTSTHPSGAPAGWGEEVEDFYRSRYQGFTVKRFHEHLVKDYDLDWSYTWTKTFLQSR
jgi:hypothetical protein